MLELGLKVGTNYKVKVPTTNKVIDGLYNEVTRKIKKIYLT